MNRKLLCAMSVAFVMIACSVTSALGDFLTLQSDTAIPRPFGTTTPFDITAAGNLDWILPGYDRKVGGTIIGNNGGPQYTFWGTGGLAPSSDQPQFSYTNGTNSASATVAANHNYSTPWTSINLPAGSGTVTLWSGDGGPSSGYSQSAYNAWFNDDHDGTVIVVPFANGAWRKGVFEYQIDAPRVLNLSSDAGSGAWNEGWFGIAVSQVPEPSTITLISIGLVGMLAYAWRKRR